MSVLDAEKYMKIALNLAKRGKGMTSPNPMVGAVVVKGGKIIGKGYHEGPGNPHAEVIALNMAGEDACGATLYTTLEPCCHTDKRTPPCTKEIIKRKIKKVVIAMADPNPAVDGRGISELKRAGIEVVTGIMEEKAKKQNEAYTKHVTTGRPFVILKIASSLDGRIALPSGESKWITGERARLFVQKLREGVDAILTGVGTVLADDPMLNVRIRTRRKRQPLRVIVDSHLSIPLTANVIRTANEQSTLVVTTHKASTDRIKEIKNHGANILYIEPTGSGWINMDILLDHLGKEGIMSLLVEGGSRVITSFLQEGLTDKIIVIYGPIIIGGDDSIPMVKGTSPPSLDKAIRITDSTVRKIGDDIVVEGYIK